MSMLERAWRAEMALVASPYAASDAARWFVFDASPSAARRLTPRRAGADIFMPAAADDEAL